MGEQDPDIRRVKDEEKLAELREDALEMPKYTRWTLYHATSINAPVVVRFVSNKKDPLKNEFTQIIDAARTIVSAHLKSGNIEWMQNSVIGVDRVHVVDYDHYDVEDVNPKTLSSINKIYKTGTLTRDIERISGVVMEQNHAPDELKDSWGHLSRALKHITFEVRGVYTDVAADNILRAVLSNTNKQNIDEVDYLVSTLKNMYVKGNVGDHIEARVLEIMLNEKTHPYAMYRMAELYSSGLATNASHPQTFVERLVERQRYLLTTDRYKMELSQEQLENYQRYVDMIESLRCME